MARQEAHRNTVLVVGATGFLGGFIVAGLRRHGYRVLLGVRSPRTDAVEERRCDLAVMKQPGDWRDTLAGVDVVVNAAGILRETGTQTFEAVHIQGPIALAQACVESRTRRFVQISALGDPEDAEFVASKHRFDVALLSQRLSALVLRPSVVYATEGSYGGTSLLRALAALPFGIWVPGDGHWQLQPVAAQDLAEIVARAIDSDASGVHEIGGPAPVSLCDYQRKWRQWLRIRGTRVIKVPLPLVSLQMRVAELLGRGPMGATMWRMLRRGNITALDAHVQIKNTFGYAPRALDAVLPLHPSQAQDRWHARLYFLAPLLRAALVVLWTLSGAAGLLTPEAGIEAMIGASVPHALALARAAGCVDFAFAIWLISGYRTRRALVGMAAMVLLYTVAFSVWLPSAWVSPMGGLAKNLVILPALAVLWALSERR